jgi:hypothetical protein
MSILTLSTTERTQQPVAREQGRLSVPWKTVLPLAVVMAYADGFWLTTLSGAIGAIERTQSPFTSWLRESTMVLPVFIIAVLGALTLALRWFGPVLRTRRAVVATALLVVAASSLVGIAAIAASSAYDYHLQTHQLGMMDAMRSVCTGNCLAKVQHATLTLHIRGVAYIGRWLLLTNVVLAAWLVAMWGGRMKVSTAKRQSDAASDAPILTGRSRVEDLRLVLVAVLVASAAIHAAVIPEHLTEWPAAGMFFVLLTVWELVVAGFLLARLDERPVLLAAAAISLGPLLLWTVSRTVGLPFGPEPGAPEAVGLADIAACVLEVASLVAAVVLLRARGWLARRPSPSAHVRSLVLVSVLAVTAIGLGGAELTVFDAFGMAATHSVMDMTH